MRIRLENPQNTCNQDLKVFFTAKKKGEIEYFAPIRVVKGGEFPSNK